jgi:hypothetical protein
MGEGSASKEAPLGRKQEPKKGEAAPVPPKELEGVRKVGETTPAPIAGK